MTIKAKKSKINLREKLAELLNFRQIRDRLDGLGLYLGKDRTGTAENLAVRGGANIDDLQLAEISAALGGTAVDVFVYDTRNDSDGGKWRERTSHTSWYNEDLNTATRGSRREFPAVAVIVAEAKRITIYDGDDPDLPMWMVFKEAVYTSPQHRNIMYASGNMTSIYALNGFIITDSQGVGFWSPLISFLRDGCLGLRGGQSTHMIYEGNLAERNAEHDLYWNGPQTDESWWLKDRTISNYVHDVAMTVLPNAPIDTQTGLPIPTIAVATDGGVSVIKDDGTVVDITCSNVSFKYSYYVVFDQLNRLFFSLDGLNNSRRIWGLNDIPAGDLVVTTDINEKQNGDIFIADDNGFGTATKDMFLFNQSNPHAMGFTSDNSIGTNKNLFKSFINQEDSGKSLYNYITSAYNTGWMCGDIKLATLSDTKIEKVGVDETNSVIDNGESWSGVTDATTEPTGWTLETAGSTNYSVASGELTITQLGTANAKIYQSFDVVKGGVYDVEVRYKANSGTARYQVSNNAVATGHVDDLLLDITTTSYVTERKTFRAETTGKYSIGISCYGTGASATFDYVTIKQTGELITNGTFENGTTGWVARSGSSISVSGGQLTAVCSGNYDGVQVDSSYLPSLESGKRYVMSVDIDSISNGEVAFGVVSGSTFSGTTSPGIYSVTFTASNTTEVWIDNRGSSVSTFVLNSVSIRLAEEDRSVNDNGLQIFGEIDKTPVAPGADLVAYNGFSENNYLMQPYNSDLDFGTGDFCIMGWFKGTSTNGTILDRANSGATLGRVTLTFSTYLEFKTIFNGSTITCASNKSISDNTWHYFSVVRRDGKLSMYIDGFLSSSEEDSNHDLSNPDAYLNVGLRYNLAGSLGSGDNLALLRASANAPTPEQIAKIYRDEKPLFQDGAQATLYGTSDAVTALAYDDKTELLHVGTSGGRSDFAGLRRINNTTIPVTTSISASNNLIAEQ